MTLPRSLPSRALNPLETRSSHPPHLSPPFSTPDGHRHSISMGSPPEARRACARAHTHESESAAVSDSCTHNIPFHSPARHVPPGNKTIRFLSLSLPIPHSQDRPVFLLPEGRTEPFQGATPTHSHISKVSRVPTMAQQALGRQQATYCSRQPCGGTARTPPFPDADMEAEGFGHLMEAVGLLGVQTQALNPG